MFKNREQAGKILAPKLKAYQEKKSVILAITRGGVLVAQEVALSLNLPFYPIIVKKIGAPGNGELAIGALTYENTFFLDEELAKSVGADLNYVQKQVENKKEEIKQLQLKYNQVKAIPVREKQVIVIDDGVATGATIMAVIKYLKKKKAREIILAVPVIALDTFNQLKKSVKEIITLKKPESFMAVGQFYQQFYPVTDKQIKEILQLN